MAVLPKEYEVTAGGAIRVHEHGHIKLEMTMGGDLSIVNGARMSFNKEHEKLDESDEGLINFLMRERHGTPFEMVEFAFDVKAPIFIFREWMRHRIGSFNEMSGRYTKLLPEFYVPRGEYVRELVGKQGNYTYQPMSEEMQKRVEHEIEANFWRCWEEYETMLEEGVAKEVARMVLPVNIYSRMKWKVNLRALFNFLSLRTHETAQREIRDYANVAHMLSQTVAPIAFEAFDKHGRVCP